MRVDPLPDPSRGAHAPAAARTLRRTRPTRRTATATSPSAKLQKIDRFHVEQLAYLLGQLAAVDDGRGALLDNTLIVFGSAIGDGDRHDHHDLPILLCGRGGGVAGGRHLRFARETPLCNLYLSILQRAGVRATSFGDSKGALEL